VDGVKQSYDYMFQVSATEGTRTPSVHHSRVRYDAIWILSSDT
jgi:hypothetical protein